MYQKLRFPKYCQLIAWCWKQQKYQKWHETLHSTMLWYGCFSNHYLSSWIHHLWRSRTTFVLYFLLWGRQVQRNSELSNLYPRWFVESDWRFCRDISWIFVSSGKHEIWYQCYIIILNNTIPFHIDTIFIFPTDSGSTDRIHRFYKEKDGANQNLWSEWKTQRLCLWR